MSEYKSLHPRPEIEKLLPVHHGAPDFAELENLNLMPGQVIDFSVNSNPYGPAPVVRQSLKSVPLDRYPDREALNLRRALSRHHNVSLESILVTNGTAELIWLIALTYLQPGDPVLILGPTFGEYAHAAALMGAEIHTWAAQPEKFFTFQPDQIEQQFKQTNFRLVFVCNPNNPTGQVLPSHRLNIWAEQHPETLFVVDEAYIAFAEGMPSTLQLEHANILVMRSMTKDYALAGLRLGYAVGNKAVIQALGKARPPWSVNALAQAGGIAALKSQNYYKNCWQKILKNKTELVAGLVSMGLSPILSRTHFFLLPVENGPQFRNALMEAGLQVRDCASFGLPSFVRIATRRPEENQKLLAAIKLKAT
ncbi:MAG: histidinol-phosphate transaminase [Chloroflexota bacterium]|nr:histidinol-phosphate transaminase [Chloroflexota bacterium]